MNQKLDCEKTPFEKYKEALREYHGDGMLYRFYLWLSKKTKKKNVR